MFKKTKTCMALLAMTGTAAVVAPVASASPVFAAKTTVATQPGVPYDSVDDVLFARCVQDIKNASSKVKNFDVCHQLGEGSLTSDQRKCAVGFGASVASAIASFVDEDITAAAMIGGGSGVVSALNSCF